MQTHSGVPSTSARRRVAGDVISDERLAAQHAYTRAHSVNWPLYVVVRLLFVPFFLVYFRLSRTGRKYARNIDGGLIVAANHRSFLDPFVVGAMLPFRRLMNYVAKVELFEKPWQAWFLSRLGAFPIRRGLSDEDSMETARMVVERGGTLCIFPEGTRHRSGSLANPKRGVGRLALQTGAPILPTAVIGTEKVRRGWRIRPRKVKVRCGKAMTFPRSEEPSQQLAETVTARIWPNVLLQWEDLGGVAAARRAAVVGARRADGPRRARGAARGAQPGSGGGADRGGGKPPLPARGEAAGDDRRAAGGRDRARRPRLHRPRDPVQIAARRGRLDRRPGRRPLLDPPPHQGPDRAAGAAALGVRRRTGAGAGARQSRRPRPRGR